MYPVKSLHIELTDKCQAACPMCARNSNGGPDRPFVGNNEITIKQFKQWFPVEFLSRLTNFFASGNYGDPAFANDCFEIFQYVRSCNTTVGMAMHTNGSLRTTQWWADLAKAMGANSEVIFAVDGFKGKHELYRRNTDFDKIIDNIKAFVAAGGRAKVNSLVFAHNEHDTNNLEKFLLGIGVATVEFRSTTRFYSMPKSPVVDKDGQHVYDLYPAQLLQYKQVVAVPLERFLDTSFRTKVAKEAVIEPKCEASGELYIDAKGNAFPCSYIGSDYVEQPVEETSVLSKLRNISAINTQELVNAQNLNITTIYSILNTDFSYLWTSKTKCLTCVNICSSSVR